MNLGYIMKEVYWEIKINYLSGPRQAKFWQKSGPRFVYFDLPIYFLHDNNTYSADIHTKPLPPGSICSLSHSYLAYTFTESIKSLIHCHSIVSLLCLCISFPRLRSSINVVYFWLNAVNKGLFKKGVPHCIYTYVKFTFHNEIMFKICLILKILSKSMWSRKEWKRSFQSPKQLKIHW